MTGWTIEFVKERFGISPDFPFDDMGETAVFRNPNNAKWFGIIMRGIPLAKLGVDSPKRADVINLKCDPMLSFTIRDNKRIFKGYHMNKEHWITVLLDGSVGADELESLITMSYNIIDKRTKEKNKK